MPAGAVWAAVSSASCAGESLGVGSLQPAPAGSRVIPAASCPCGTCCAAAWGFVLLFFFVFGFFPQQYVAPPLYVLFFLDFFFAACAVLLALFGAGRAAVPVWFCALNLFVSSRVSPGAGPAGEVGASTLLPSACGAPAVLCVVGCRLKVAPATRNVGPCAMPCL